MISKTLEKGLEENKTLTESSTDVCQYLTLYVQFCAPDDGQRNRLKHVEQFIEMDRSRKRCILLDYFRENKNGFTRSRRICSSSLC
jgi:hypothetical protein